MRSAICDLCKVNNFGSHNNNNEQFCKRIWSVSCCCCCVCYCCCCCCVCCWGNWLPKSIKQKALGARPTSCVEKQYKHRGRRRRRRRRRRKRERRQRQKRGKKCLNICKRNRWKIKTFGNAVAINQSRVNESAIKTGCLRGGGKVERERGSAEEVRRGGACLKSRHIWGSFKRRKLNFMMPWQPVQAIWPAQAQVQVTDAAVDVAVGAAVAVAVEAVAWAIAIAIVVAGSCRAVVDCS